MLEDRPAGPSDEQLQELGLDRADLDTFGDDPEQAEDQLGDQEATLEGAPAPAPDAPQTPAATDQPADPARPAEPTPAAQQPAASPSSSQERPAATPGEASPAATPSAPTPAATTVVPWTPAADGRRLEIEGAVVEADGSVKIPAAGLRQLQAHLAFRPAWQERERQYQARIQALDPKNNEQVLLSELIAADMGAAAEKGEDALWAWVQEFRDKLPLLKRDARAEAIARENERLKARVAPMDQEAERQTLEPVMQQGLAHWLAEELRDPQFAALAAEQQELGAELWELRDRMFARAQQDLPEAGVRRGELYVDREAIRRELTLAVRRQQRARGQIERDAAGRRNAAALGTPPIPPQLPAGSSAAAVEAGADPGRPKTREEWIARLDTIAGPGAR